MHRLICVLTGAQYLTSLFSLCHSNIFPKIISLHCFESYLSFQASDAQNIGMQVALKKCQQQLLSGSETVVYKDSNRLSLPLEGTKIIYKPLKGNLVLMKNVPFSDSILKPFVPHFTDTQSLARDTP